MIFSPESTRYLQHETVDMRNDTRPGKKIWISCYCDD